jgi:hypothetical protein
MTADIFSIGFQSFVSLDRAAVPGADVLWRHALALTKNEAFAAFLGALFAFLLVSLTDWRRRRRIAFKSLPRRIAFASFTVAELLAVLDKETSSESTARSLPSRFMRTPLTGIRELAIDANDLLSPLQRLSVESACFMLERLDSQTEFLERMAKAYLANHKQLLPTIDSARAEMAQYVGALKEARDLAAMAIATCTKCLAEFTIRGSLRCFVRKLRRPKKERQR